MATFYNSDAIRRMLDKVASRRDYMQAPDWQTLTPKEATNVNQAVIQQDPSQLFQKIVNLSQGRANIEHTLAENRQEQQALEEAQQQYQQAKQHFVKEAPPPNVPVPDYGGSTGTYSVQRWGKDRLPEVSDIQTLKPHAPIVSVNSHGINFQVNSQVAPIFLSFLDDLYKMGYHPKSIGGYSVRNIAGTNTPSLHSYGFAIDIDPSKNPVTWNGQNVTALPPGVGALAAKYGLSWGGAWNGEKRDPMHFSVAYGGTQ